MNTDTKFKLILTRMSNELINFNKHKACVLFDLFDFYDGFIKLALCETDDKQKLKYLLKAYNIEYDNTVMNDIINLLKSNKNCIRQFIEITEKHNKLDELTKNQNYSHMMTQYFKQQYTYSGCASGRSH